MAFALFRRPSGSQPSAIASMRLYARVGTASYSAGCQLRHAYIRWTNDLQGKLMLALQRSGRQADALATYQGLRTRLLEELGSNPGQPLQQLHQHILSC